KKAWQSGAEVDLESRITMLVEMFKDFKSFGITKKADTKEEIDSNLASAEQTLSNLTSTVLDPLLKFIKMVTGYLGWVFEDNPTSPKNTNKNNHTGGPPPPSPTPFGGNPEDNNNNTP
ncbi:DUF759 family protein, partial [Borreliella valaisiana]|uniref:DUF759 family protein n=1 Tax=Borreliella valaisiana TaxID=62088 RepID=UPI001AEE685C